MGMGGASPGNIFTALPGDQTREVFEQILQLGEVRLERIVSRGHRSPEGFWYDQPGEEWVMLVRGNAILHFAKPEQVIEMSPGDYVRIPAHCRHRVEWTDPDTESIWLAIHLPALDGKGRVP
jgi:cupin 2 domain-containing protein